MQITLNLTEDQAERLKQLAEFLGVDPSELARAALSDLLSHPADDFRRAASYVLQKNRQVYERLI